MAGPVMLSFFALSRQKPWAVLLAAFGGATAATLAPTTLRWSSPRPFLDTLTHLVDWSEGSGAGRIAEWRDTFALFKTHPIWGVGPGNWFAEYGLSHRNAHFSHSDVLGLLAERGLIGATLLLALAVVVLRNCPTEQRPAVFASVIAAGGLGVFDSVTQLPAPLLLLSCTCFVGSRADAQPCRDSSSAAAFALLTLLSLSSLVSLRLSTAGADFDRLERAVRFNPLDAELRFQLAEAWLLADDCERACPHIDALRRLLPTHPKLKTLSWCERAPLNDAR